MAVCFGRYNEGEKVEFIGCVLRTYEHNGSWDSDWYAEVWDENERRVRTVCYDTTRAATCGSWADVDATVDSVRKAYRYYASEARKEFDRYVNEHMAKSVRAGDVVTVTRGRKVPKGTTGTIFWIGKSYNSYSGHYEDRVGIEVDGARMFVPAEYVEVNNWGDRMLHGNARKKAIRRMAIRNIPERFHACV